MPEDLHQMIESLTGKMLRKKYVMATFKAKGGPETLAPHLKAHLEYMIELSRSGAVFLSGPLVNPDGSPTGNGVTVFNTTNVEHARGLAEADPFTKHGLRDFELQEWVLMEGAMTVKLNFAETGFDVA